MASFNQVTLVGNVVRDPETRFLQGGKQVTKFSLAVNGSRKSDTMFVDVVTWEGTAKIVSDFVSKGKSLLVSGRLSIRSYEDKDGNTRRITEVIGNTIQLLSPRTAGATRPAEPGEPGDAGHEDEYGDQIPF